MIEYDYYSYLAIERDKFGVGLMTAVALDLWRLKVRLIETSCGWESELERNIQSLQLAQGR